MALKRCPECREPVAQQLKACQSCGCPLLDPVRAKPAPRTAQPAASGFWTWLAAMVVLFGIGFGGAWIHDYAARRAARPMVREAGASTETTRPAVSPNLPIHPLSTADPRTPRAALLAAVNTRIRASNFTGAIALLTTERAATNAVERSAPTSHEDYFASAELDRMTAALRVGVEEHGGSIRTRGRIDALVQQLWSIHADQYSVHSVAIGPDSEWIIIYTNGEYVSRGLPEPLRMSLAKISQAGQRVKLVAFGPDHCWVLLHDSDGFQTTANTPKALSDELRRVNNLSLEITGASMNQSGGWVVTNGRNGYTTHGVHPTLIDALKQMHAAGSEFRFVSISDTDCWVIGTNTTEFRSWAPSALEEKMRQFTEQHEEIRHVAFAPGGKWLLIRNDCDFSSGLTP